MIPLNPLLSVWVVLIIGTTAIELWVGRLNQKRVKENGGIIPPVFGGIIDAAELERISRYSVEKMRARFWETLTLKFFWLSLVLFGFLPWLADALRPLPFVLQGLVFFGVPGLIAAVLQAPFDFDHTFRIEARYGFNTQTRRLWLADLLKSLLLGGVLGGLLLSVLLVAVQYAGADWWIPAWAFFIGFQLLLTVCYPVLIAPLFNTFTPITDAALTRSIQTLVEKQGFHFSGVFRMDAGRRTRHSNAYFAGLGRSKRVVLYDTLLEAYQPKEILAVLAHEIGHLKKHHLQIQLVLITVVSGILFFTAARLIATPALYAAFGFSSEPAWAGLFLAGLWWAPLSFLLGPAAMGISRAFERQADLFAVRLLRSGKPLISALKHLAKDNLANLHPHPAFVFFNYSHPPLLQRIESIAAAERPPRPLSGVAGPSRSAAD